LDCAINVIRDSFKKRVSAEDLRATDPDAFQNDDEHDEQSAYVMDAFLVFRAFAKLSSKDISAERYTIPFEWYLTSVVQQT
jgi:hypothetical protein